MRKKRVISIFLALVLSVLCVAPTAMHFKAGVNSGFGGYGHPKEGSLVDVTPQPKLDGQKNGNFVVGDYPDNDAGTTEFYTQGYCCQNNKKDWAVGTTLKGAVYEWDNPLVRKILYYAKSSTGEERDAITYAMGYINGDIRNDDRAWNLALSLIESVKDEQDPIVYGRKAYKVVLDNPAYQNIVAMSTGDAEEEPPKGSIRIIKESSNPEINNNLEGAEFDLYSDEACTELMYFARTELQEDGSYEARFTNVAYGTYYLKETKAPQGFVLDATVHKVVVDSPYYNLITLKNDPGEAGLVIKKTSTLPDLVKPDNCYTFTGTTFGVYKEYSCETLVTTLSVEEDYESDTLTHIAGMMWDEEGFYYGLTPAAYLEPGVYYVKETATTESYFLNEEVKEVTVRLKETAMVEFVNEPVSADLDPYAVLLHKKNPFEGLANVEIPSLKGAEFTFSFYAAEEAQYENGEIVKPEREPDRVWVLATDEDGYCRLTDEWKVSGDEFYLSPTGTVTLPIGVLVIKETKAPEAYHINTEEFIVEVTPESTQDDIFLSYQVPIIPEIPLNLVKLSKKCTSGGEILDRIEFVHEKPNGEQEIIYVEPTRIGMDEYVNEIALANLEEGKHVVYETKAPLPYIVNPSRVEFTVSEVGITFTNQDELDDSVTFTQEPLYYINKAGDAKVNTITIYNDKIDKFDLVINKTNDNGLPLSNAEFTLTEVETGKETVLQTRNGVLTFPELKTDVEYSLAETKAPAGYKTYSIGDDEEPLVLNFGVYVNGDLDGNTYFEMYFADNDTDVGNEVYLNQNNPSHQTDYGTVRFQDTEGLTVTYDAINEVGHKLPNTGSSATIYMLLIGVCLVCICLFTRNETKKGRKKFMKMKFGKAVVGLALALTVAISGVSLSDTGVSAAEKTTSEGKVDFNRGDAEITIVGNQGQSLAGKKFMIYKLLNAENSEGLESINYSFNDDYKAALQTIVGTKLNKDAADVTEYEVIDYIQSLNNNIVEGANAEQTNEGSYSEFRYFIEDLRNEIVDSEITGDIINAADCANGNTIIVSGLEYGYYIVDEITNVQDSHSAASLCIVTTANPEASMSIKSDYPSVVHKIQEDDNASAVGNHGWNDIADYEIGQTVPFKYESNVPNMNGYDTYYYAWHDVMDSALTFHTGSVTVKISDQDKTYTLAPSEFTVTQGAVEGETFLIEIADLKALVDREFDQKNALQENVYGQTVTVTFDATLNDKAALDMGRSGYENDVQLEFSNNPDFGGAAQTGFTPVDTVVCFTYKLDVLKTNNKDLKLANAKFRLYSDEECSKEVFVKQADNGYVVINADSIIGQEAPEEAVEMVSDVNGSIIINGLDSHVYYLKETKAPAGYRKLNDAIVLSINPTYTNLRDEYVKGDGATNKTLQKLTASAEIKTFLSGLLGEEKLDLVTDVETGTINITVVNTVGSKLPITGSALTIIMLVGGCACVGFYFFSKKKEAKNDKENY